jgi:hypothetical protein
MDERRRTPRAACRLHCRVARGREPVRSRIIDISEGGICLISPVWLKPKEAFDVSIDVPGTGLAKVRAEIWHIRREKSRTTNERVWMAGASLVDADEAYSKLLRAAGVAPAIRESTAATSTGATSTESIDQIEATVYRIRCKARVGPRTRVLTLAADSEDEAREFAVRDLGETWTVLEIRKA